MKERKRDFRFVHLLGILSFAMVMAVAALNYPLVGERINAFVHRTQTFDKTTKEISEAYRSDDLWGKDAYITWNGLFARLSGRRVYNDVTLMSNGMITSGASTKERIPDCEPTVTRISTLNEFLASRGISFLYVQEPHKNTLQGEMLPRGSYISNNNTAERLLLELMACGVKTLDLIPLIAGSEELINAYFYRTDHHWTADGAFLAYGKIMDEMEQLLGEKLDKSTTDGAVWERHVLQDWWLGSRGRRVGPWYAGTDDLMWDTPLFDTAYSVAIPSRTRFIYGNYEEVVVYPKYILEKNLLHHNAHQLYFGGDCPLMQFRNVNAANQQKVLVIKDSYARPVMAYMSTAFSELDVLDPRHYQASSIAQYIEWSKPDIVLIMCNSGMVLSEEFMVDFGCEELTTWEEAHQSPETVMEMEQVAIQASNQKYYSYMLMDDLVPGAVYEIEIQNVQVTVGETAAFTLLLYDQEEGTVTWSNIFDIEYGKLQGKGYQWKMLVPEGNYALMVCPGTYSEAGEITMELKGIRIMRE